MFSQPTEEERIKARHNLSNLFADIEQLHETFQSTPSVEERSVLWFDDRLTRPYQTSHVVSYLLLTAVDHLHCLRTVMVEAKSQHIFAPFTLIRSAIESASTAVWLLSPKDRAVRVTRSLQLERNNLTMFGKALTAIGIDPETSIAARLALLQEAVQRAGADSGAVMGSFPAVQTIIRKASEEARMPRLVLGAWQLSSGSAHGKTWAGQQTSTFVESPETSTADVLSGVLTSNETAIYQVLFPALVVVNRGMELQSMRGSRRLQASGASFIRTAKCEG